MRSIAVLSLLADTAHGACPLVPTGAVPNGDGATFPAIFAKQQLGFHECDSPLVDGEFPEGAKCGKISCHGASNHISQSDVVCSNGNWMQQDDTRVSGVPNCPRGCLASENTWTISRCRKNFMDGVESYEDGDETYFWPGQRCKKVQCSAIRKPRHGAKNDTKKFWKLIAKSFFECVCQQGSDTCVWSDLTNAAVAAFNSDIELECSGWAEWTNHGKCINGQQGRSRECHVDLTSYDKTEEAEALLARSGQHIPGTDCIGDDYQMVPC